MTVSHVIYIAGVQHDLIVGKVTGVAIYRDENGALIRRKVSTAADPLWSHGEATRRLRRTLGT